MAKGSGASYLAVGLAVGSAYYLRNVAFPGEQLRPLKSPSALRGPARG
jgi:hypothetical protein